MRWAAIGVMSELAIAAVVAGNAAGPVDEPSKTEFGIVVKHSNARMIKVGKADG